MPDKNIKKINPVQKKLKRKSKSIVILYVLGFFLLALSTYSFSFIIPNMEEKLSAMQIEMRKTLFTNVEFGIQQHNIQMLCALHDILYEVNSKSIRLKPFYNKIKYYQKTLIKQTYYEIKGSYPSTNELQKWDSLDANQLDNTLYSILMENSYDVSDVNGGIVGKYKMDTFTELEKLENKKNDWLFWTILLQILGLGINQLAIILELSKK